MKWNSGDICEHEVKNETRVIWYKAKIVTVTGKTAIIEFPCGTSKRVKVSSLRPVLLCQDYLKPLVDEAPL